MGKKSMATGVTKKMYGFKRKLPPAVVISDDSTSSSPPTSSSSSSIPSPSENLKRKYPWFRIPKKTRIDPDLLKSSSSSDSPLSSDLKNSKKPSCVAPSASISPPAKSKPSDSPILSQVRLLTWHMEEDIPGDADSGGVGNLPKDLSPAASAERQNKEVGPSGQSQPHPPESTPLSSSAGREKNKGKRPAEEPSDSDSDSTDSDLLSEFESLLSHPTSQPTSRPGGISLNEPSVAPSPPTGLRRSFRLLRAQQQELFEKVRL